MDDSWVTGIQDDVGSLVDLIPRINKKISNVAGRVTVLSRRIEKMESTLVELQSLVQEQLHLQRDAAEDRELLERLLKEREEGSGDDDDDTKPKPIPPVGSNILEDAVGGIVAALSAGVIASLPQVIAGIKANAPNMLGYDEGSVLKELVPFGVRRVAAAGHFIGRGLSAVGHALGLGSAEEGGEVAEGVLPKIATKVGLKGLLKAVPFVGALFSVFSAMQRIEDGDYVGAIIDSVTAVADLTGVGSAVGLGLVLTNAVRDATGSGAETNAEILRVLGGDKKKVAEAIFSLPGIVAMVHVWRGARAATSGDWWGAAKEMYAGFEDVVDPVSSDNLGGYQEVGQWMASVVQGIMRSMEQNPTFGGFMTLMKGFALLPTNPAAGMSLIAQGGYTFFSTLPTTTGDIAHNVETGVSDVAHHIFGGPERNEDNAMPPVRGGTENPYGVGGGHVRRTVGGHPDFSGGIIVHHTGSRSLSGAVETLRERGLSANYVVGRDGQVVTLLDPAKYTAAHMLPSAGFGGRAAATGANNSDTIGIEVAANDDSDVTPAERMAVQRLIHRDQQRFGIDPSKVYGHGYVNPGHKEADEGYTEVNDYFYGARHGGQLAPSRGAGAPDPLDPRQRGEPYPTVPNDYARTDPPRDSGSRIAPPPPSHPQGHGIAHATPTRGAPSINRSAAAAPPRRAPAGLGPDYVPSPTDTRGAQDWLHYFDVGPIDSATALSGVL